MTNPTPRDSAQLPPLTFADWLAQPVDFDMLGPNITHGSSLSQDQRVAAEYGWSAAAREALRAQAASVEPYGQITTHTETGQQFFYRWPQSPYLDNASECVTVYAGAPPAQAASVPVAYRVDWPVEAGLGLPRFFGADDRERMDNWVRDRECTVHPLVYAGAPPAPASVPVLVASVMGLDVYDTPNGEPAQAVDAVGEQNSFERARERGTFGPPLDCCPTWYATELRMEGWRARAALQASHQPQPQAQHGGGESTATKLAKRTCEANAEAARFTIALQTLRASLDPDDWMGPVTMHAYIDKVLAGGSPLNPDCTLTAKEPK